MLVLRGLSERQNLRPLRGTIALHPRYDIALADPNLKLYEKLNRCTEKNP